MTIFRPVRTSIGEGQQVCGTFTTRDSSRSNIVENCYSLMTGELSLKYQMKFGKVVETLWEYQTTGDYAGDAYNNETGSAVTKTLEEIYIL